MAWVMLDIVVISDMTDWLTDWMNEWKKQTNKNNFTAISVFSYMIQQIVFNMQMKGLQYF